VVFDLCISIRYNVAGVYMESALPYKFIRHAMLPSLASPPMCFAAALLAFRLTPNL
jgi:hypothetical protein